MKRGLHTAAWLLSGAALAVMLADFSAEGAITAAALLAVVAAIALRLGGLRAPAGRLRPGAGIAALAIAALAGGKFYQTWIISDYVDVVAGPLGLSRSALLLALAVVGAAVSLYGAYAAACAAGGLAEELAGGCAHENGDTRLTARELLFLLGLSALAITVCSKSSPLYPLNDWVDANCFLTTGRAMADGQVLYRDIVEQKGFYLYVVHMLACLISDSGFLGVYVCEIAAAFAFLMLAMKTARLLRGGRIACGVMALFAAATYTSAAFCFGDSAEELCLPLLGYALYVGLKAIREGRAPLMREALLIGVTSGVVLFTKYTLLGFYLGWFAAMALILREGRSVLRMIGGIAAGVALAALPVLAYFAAHGALGDLWQVYFYNNMFLYSGVRNTTPVIGTLFNIALHTVQAIQQEWLLSAALAVSLLGYARAGGGRVAALLGCCALGLCATVCMGKLTFFTYYALAFYVLAPAALPWMQAAADRFAPGRARALCAAALCALLLFNNSAYMLGYDREDLPQFAFAQITDRVENATMLNYGFLDGGFYTASGIVPTCKYFCRLNLVTPESAAMEADVLARGLTDFIVTKNEQLRAPLYACVAQQAYFNGESEATYYLYARTALNFEP